MSISSLKYSMPVPNSEKNPQDKMEELAKP